jgi:predicted nucleotide-binding protein (sugar kinase/HSP70/actin superfamily)
MDCCYCQILVKFHPDANNDIVVIIEKEDVKAIVQNFLNFFFYSVSDRNYKYRYLNTPFTTKLTTDFLLWIIGYY